MLVDKVTLQLSAGKGGDGVVRWRKEKAYHMVGLLVVTEARVVTCTSK